jgi:hypothetical protein
MFADRPQHDAQEQKTGDGHHDDVFVRYCTLELRRGAAIINMEWSVTFLHLQSSVVNAPAPLSTDQNG